MRLQAEAGKVDDWHDNGIATNPAPMASAVDLNSAPRRLRAIFGGLFPRFQL